MLDIDEYLKQREISSGRPVMHQNWRELLFLHFSVDPEAVQKLMPAGLTVDTCADRAWIGLVLFRMEGIRTRNGPAAPWLSAFPETNVRTYVHREGREPGVWFFSLDAARWLACRFARQFFGLPYYHSLMSVRRTGLEIEYDLARQGKPGVNADIKARIGDELPETAPGSLDFFLIERYLLYAKRRGSLFTGRVSHSPYPLKTAEVVASKESLIHSIGIQSKPWEHVCFSEGVDVQVLGLDSN
ncbi:MAG TPA: DUF2071 domain-containing protein [Fimbriimonadaceae bacterium]|jgi:hypothetical protein